MGALEVGVELAMNKTLEELAEEDPMEGGARVELRGRHSRATPQAWKF